MPFLIFGAKLTTYTFDALGVHEDVLFALKRGIALGFGYFYVFGLSRWISAKLGLINIT